MSKFTSKYSSKKGYTFKAPQERNYASLKDLYNIDDKATYKVNALYINRKNKFGASPVVASEGVYVNLPIYLTPQVEEMIDDEELTDYINEGNFGFRIYEYTGKNGIGYNVRWVDLK